MHMPLRQKNIICFGELLWDILPTGALPGGAPMNVAYHLNRLGLSPALITRVGQDERGTELLRLAAQHGIITTGVQLDPETPTGIVLAQPGEGHEMHYDIVIPSAWDNITGDPALEAQVKTADYFIFGSLAARNAASRSTLLRLLETPATKVLDINLRPPHFTRGTIETLLHKADILKMNEAELALISGWYGSHTGMTENIALLREKFNIPTIIVTMGAAGAMADVEGTIYRHPGFKVQVADTVGSGDAFLAAFLSGIIRQKKMEDTLEFAAALGALVASKTGGWPAYAVEDIDVIAEK